MNRLPDKPLIYCISEGRADDSNFRQAKQEIIGKIRNASECGVNLFQIREKKLSTSLLFELAQEAAETARGLSVTLLINGRADVALAAGAHGVHLPSDSVPARRLREYVPDDFIIGVSTHSAEEVSAAKADGADFAVFGTVFSSPGKGDGVGIDQLSVACRRAEPFPVLALGGVNETNVEDVLRTGAAGFAAIRYLNEMSCRE